MFSRMPQYFTHQFAHFIKCRLVSVLLVVLATLLGMFAPLANAAQTVVYGPKTASISPKKGNSTDVFTDIDVYTLGRNVKGPFTLVVENQSPDIARENKKEVKNLKIEIFHNSQRVATTGDFFKSNGQAISSFEKTLRVRPFSNSFIVKVIGKVPVQFTYKIVAGQPDAGPSLITGLGPNPLSLVNGENGVLNATLSPAPAVAGTLALSSSNSGVATVPDTVPFTAGQSSVAIPVQSKGTGQASVIVQINGSSASANVDVAPAPAKVVSLLPTQSTIQQGASGELQVVIAPGQLQETVVTLLSSDPSKVSVPATVLIPAGQTSASFVAEGILVGNAQVTASLSNASGPSSAAAQVQVVPVPPSVVSILPATSVLQKGSTAQLVVKLSASQSTDTIVVLQARTNGVVDVPGSVVVPAGASQIGFAVNAVEVGNTLVAASLNGSTVESAVQVTPVPAAVAALAPATSTVVVGGTSQLTLKLNNAQSTVTTVALAADPSGIVQVPGTVQVPAGETELVFAATALAVGQADVVATLNGSSQRARVVVSPLPAAIAEVSPNPFALQEGASGDITVKLNNAQSAAVTVNLAVANPNLLRAPESFVIPAGQVSQNVTVQALQAGTTQLVASLNDSSQTVTVNITVPPPQIATLEPATQDLPKGKLGKLAITLDRSPSSPALVSLGSTNSTVLGLPAQVTIPAGQMSVEIPMTALSIGQVTVTASLNGSSSNVQVNVVEPEIVGIVLTPDTLTVNPGQSTQVQAVATYSDGSSKDITTGQGTVWSTASETIATVTPEGRVTGVAQGQTILTATQIVQPTFGNPTPTDIVAQAVVVVGSPDPLAISAAKTALLTGETVVVSITAPYAAGATAYTVNLSSNGTAALQHPAAVTINPGLVSVNVNVTATSAGTAQLTASSVQFASGEIEFSVTDPVINNVAITGLAPTSGMVGSVVTIDGSGFTSPANSNNVAFAGNAPAVVQSGTATQLVVSVPELAQTGPITVSNANGSAQSDTFTVLREQDFNFQASPSSVNIIQGSSAGVVLNLASVGTNNFEGLARLTATGLPQGVTATFETQSLSAFQTGKLTLQADSSAALASATVTVQAEATLNGLPWVRQSNVAVRVVSKAGVTGVKGRFITPEGNGIAGIIVRQDSTTNQVLTDAAGNFTITGLASGVTTLRFDATPANPLYPIWPYNVTLTGNEVLTIEDWIINPPPADDMFRPINNAVQDQQIIDERFPGFAVTMPAGVTITGWDGVRKTRIAVEKIDPTELPVGAPPIPIKEAYQLYFGTPMGGIPSAPIPVTLPNVAEKDPGEKVEIWWFDGSPMGGTGDWKMAGMGTVGADGKTVSSDPGVGIPRFCGVCGLVCLNAGGNPNPPQPPPTNCPQQGGNPVDLFTGQEMASTGGLSCGGQTPIETGMNYNPVDAFNNVAGTVTSLGFGWTFDYDISFLPFAGPQKRLVMPGGQFVNMVDDGTGKFRTVDDPRFSGAYAQALNGSQWEVVLKDGTKWQFEPFSGIPGIIRGGPPLFITKITDRNGAVIAISRQSDGRIQTINGLAGRGVALSYGSNGFASSITDHTGRIQSYEYNAENRISKVTDAAGRVMEYTYQPVPTYTNTDGAAETACATDLVDNGARGIASILYPTSSTPTINTYGTDRIVKQTTSMGETWKFAYRRTGACVAKLSNSGIAGRTWDFTCRAGQSLANRKCAGGVCTTTEVGTCPDTDSDESREAGWRFYGGTTQETTVTRPDGTITRTKFNARGMPTETIDPAGQPTQYVYDASQQLTKMVDALGRVTRYEYDASGNRTAMVDALGQRVETKYEPLFNKPTQTTRFLLGVPSNQGGIELSFTPLFSSASYDSRGNLIQLTNEVGLRSTMEYNANGLMASMSPPAQVTSSTIPVVSGGVATTINRDSRKVTMSYNSAGDLIRMTDLQSNQVQIGTDDLGRDLNVTDPLGFANQMEYNTLDQQTENTDALAQTSRVVYDSANRPISVINELGAAIESYAYDNQGRLITTTNALNQAETYEYDSFNRVVKVTDRKGQVWTMAYNERSQLSMITGPDRSISYQYDTIGRVTEVRDASSVNTYQYDALNRVVQTTSTTAAGSHRLTYQYDSLNRMTQRTLSGTGIAIPQVTTFSWDFADRLLSHSTTIGGQAHTTSYSYDVAGRLAARKLQAGTTVDLITQAYGYDSLDRLSQIRYIRAQGTPAEQLIEQIDYGYDAKGQRTSKTTLNSNGTGAVETPMTAVFDAANRMTSVTLNVSMPQTYALSYDANGNLTRKQNTADAQDNTVYTWDASDRLVQIAQSGTETLTASFSYDSFGRRVQSTITRNDQPAATVQYLYEGLQALGEIRDGQLSHRLLTGLNLDETIARIALNASGQRDSAQSRIYLTDTLNSVIAQLAEDNSASLQNSYAYSPYGQTSTVGPDVTNNPNQYTSRENDNTGLYYYRARYYDPVLKRFIASDPIGLEAGMNMYAYVEGDPVSLTDPKGEIAFIPILVGIGLGYAFDYLLERYKEEHCKCKDEGNLAGPLGNALAGGAIGGTGPFTKKPRGGIAGGGRAGTATSSFSQMNHAAASRGFYSIPTRNRITKYLRKVPYAGAALAAYQIYDVLSCD